MRHLKFIIPPMAILSTLLIGTILLVLSTDFSNVANGLLI